MTGRIENDEASEKRSIVLNLRWLLILALGYLLLFHSDAPVTRGPIPWIVLGYLLSNLVLAFLPSRYFLHGSFDRALILVDTVAVSAALSQAGFQTQNLFIFYFLIILLTTLGRGINGIIANGLIIIGVYLFFLVRFHGWAALSHGRLLLQIPFLIIATVFYGVLVDREHQRYGKTLQQLQAAAEAIAGQLDLDQTLKTILKAVTELLKADAVSIMLLESDGQHLRLVQGRGIPYEYIGNTVVKIGEGVAGWIAETGRPLLLQGTLRPNEFRNHTPFARTITSAISVPLKTRDDVIGVPIKTEGRIIGVLNASIVAGKKRFNNRDLELLTLFAANISTAIERARMFSEQIRAEEMIRHQAYHDPLTDLPNRILFRDRLTLALAHAKRYNQKVAVMFLDLDHFKRINDMVGHASGDRLLKGVAERLTRTLRKSDTVARMGGDEFMMIFPELYKIEDAGTVARKILEAFKAAFRFDGHEFYATASIGISIYPDDGTDADTLAKNADAALYRAKEQGRNNYQLYSPHMNTMASERMAIENGLRRALEHQEFLLFYQPQIHLQNGEIIGAEALLRWRHPEWGLVSPAKFIPVAEETGLIIPIGEWILEAACAQNKAWHEAGFQGICVSVNLSNRQFKQKTLVKTIARALEETGLSPASLELELTESDIMQNADATISALRELKAMGIRISVDDFGTGYSSLGYLKRFPINTLKMDQCFVRNTPKDTDNAAIATAIVAMAHSLNLDVIAEGVETEEELAFLRSIRCDKMQGYLFSKPIEPEPFLQLLIQGKRLHHP
jgi:diguanylate cyclase (GGDEF)-like protein